MVVVLSLPFLFHSRITRWRRNILFTSACLLPPPPPHSPSTSISLSIKHLLLLVWNATLCAVFLLAADLGGPVWTITLQLAPRAPIRRALSAKCHAGRHALRRRCRTKKRREGEEEKEKLAAPTAPHPGVLGAEETERGVSDADVGAGGQRS